MADKPMNVYALIAAVQAEFATGGIAKAQQNTQQHYKFRGIDDVYKALAPYLAKHGLVILPVVESCEVTERESRSGSALFSVSLKVSYDLVSSHDGSVHRITVYGEAMDSGDKATNKALSAAYKYMAFQTFCIPTEGDNDADATTHEPVARSQYQDTGAPTAKQLKFLESLLKSSVVTDDERAKTLKAAAGDRSRCSKALEYWKEEIGDRKAVLQQEQEEAEHREGDLPL